MNKDDFKELKNSGFPYPKIYVKGVEYKIDHFRGDKIMTHNGDSFDYWDVSKHYNSQAIGVSIKDDIVKSLMEDYYHGDEALNKVCGRLAKKHKIKQSRIKRINDSLTIKDFKKYYNG